MCLFYSSRRGKNSTKALMPLMAYILQGKPLVMVFPHHHTYSERNSRPGSQDSLRDKGVHRISHSVNSPTSNCLCGCFFIYFCYGLYDSIILRDLSFTFAAMHLAETHPNHLSISNSIFSFFSCKHFLIWKVLIMNSYTTFFIYFYSARTNTFIKSDLLCLDVFLKTFSLYYVSIASFLLPVLSSCVWPWLAISLTCF